MLEIAIIVIVMLLVFFGLNWLMGYRKGNITLDLDERYTNLTDYQKAICKELEDQGRAVHYQGNGEFLIDGKKYLLQETNVPMGGVPLQHTILKRQKDR
ncbi:hypothetical protein [Aquibacillus kalidii]|uniref:hypothetical protein n=1 Tax=Aquibacillus kalidii TaxID=2762597 RepID=UPI0016461CA7|nr:hypothetical protein [Aquibacillus kalidii]